MILKKALGKQSHEERSYRMARYSRSAYHKFRYENKDEKVPSYYYFDCESTGTQLIVVEEKKDIIIAFRGTELDRERAKDLSTDCYFCSTTNFDINLSRNVLSCLTVGIKSGLSFFTNPQAQKPAVGFMDALNKVWNYQPGNKVIRNRLNFLRENENTFEVGLKDLIEHFIFYSTKTIWFTGHSLGGALANLAACKFIRDESLRPHCHRIGGIYTFGAPHAGNLVLANEFNQIFSSRAFRYIMHSDPITVLTPTLKGKFGQTLYINSNNKIEAHVSFVELAEGAVSEPSKALQSKSIPYLRNHDKSGYVEALKEIVYPQQDLNRIGKCI